MYVRLLKVESVKNEWGMEIGFGYGEVLEETRFFLFFLIEV